jgi:hypothetical protein
LFFLGRIGTFQRVAANPNKKFPSRPQDPPWLQKAAKPRHTPPVGAVAESLGIEYGVAEDHSGDFRFTQENVDQFVNPLVRQPGFERQ